jgi:hypothetical protein
VLERRSVNGRNQERRGEALNQHARPCGCVSGLDLTDRPHQATADDHAVRSGLHGGRRLLRRADPEANGYRDVGVGLGPCQDTGERGGRAKAHTDVPVTETVYRNPRARSPICASR